MTAELADQIPAAIDAIGSPACVGLDPVIEKLPSELSTAGSAVAAIERFSKGVIDAVAGVVPVVKPQSACFERYGSAGFAALERTVAHARTKGLVVLLDAKRGDIGISAEHYAAAAKNMGVDAITLSGYLGPSTVEPYLKTGLAVFVLVRTSNPDSDVVQSQKLVGGETVAEMMARMVAGLSKITGKAGLSAAGAVVGATKAADAQMLRKLMPRQMFLIPGYGAQGGTVDDIRHMVRPNATSAGSRGVLVTASRSVIYPNAEQGDSWTESIAKAARQFAAEIRAIV